MRVIAVLTALVTLGILVGAGQTRKTPQENILAVKPIAVPVKLVVKYDRLADRNDKLNRKFLCKGTKSYIAEKRNATWKHQDSIYAPRTPTNYAERTTKCSPYLKWLGTLWQRRAHEAYEKTLKLREPKTAICHIFGSYCSQALRVSECESGYSIWAQNGQYLGLFQMGSSERRMFGHSNTAVGQAYSAYKYFVLSGKDWSPWSCKP